MFIAGFISLGSSSGAGQFTELTVTGYNRQPITFANPVSGVTYNANPWNFGTAVALPTYSARAIYDAPTGGNLLLIAPFPTPLAPGRPKFDAGDAGELRLVFFALASYKIGAAYIGSVSADAVCGTCNDTWDVVNPVGQVSGTASSPTPLINTDALSTGVALTINRGILQATSTFP